MLQGKIDDADIEEAIRTSIDGDTYHGSYGTRDGRMWCGLCHRYHAG